MAVRNQVEEIMFTRYANAHETHDKRLDEMLAGLCARYPMQVDSVRYWFRHMLADRPNWWRHEPLFHIHVCGHIEQHFAPTETSRIWIRHQAQKAWAEFLVQRKRDNALLRTNFELAVSIMRDCDDPDIVWDKAAFKADHEGDAL